MANYFSVALTRTTRPWLMNLPEGSLTSWQELCRQSAYLRPINETDLHTVQERPGESLRSFIQWFS
jgi:Mg-chelatase subunit ChlI